MQSAQNSSEKGALTPAFLQVAQNTPTSVPPPWEAHARGAGVRPRRRRRSAPRGTSEIGSATWPLKTDLAECASKHLSQSASPDPSSHVEQRPTAYAAPLELGRPQNEQENRMFTRPAVTDVILLHAAGLSAERRCTAAKFNAVDKITRPPQKDDPASWRQGRAEDGRLIEKAGY